MGMNWNVALGIQQELPLHRGWGELLCHAQYLPSRSPGRNVGIFPFCFSRVLRRINVKKEIERWLGIVFNVKGTGTTRNTQGMCYSSCIQIVGSQQPAAGFVMKIVPTPNENSLFSWTALSKDRMGVVLILNIHLCVCVIFSTRLVVKPWIGQIGRDSFPCTVFVPRL